MLAQPHDYFNDALNNHWALGAFNTSNLEITQAIVRAAQEAAAPVIVQTSEGAIEYGGLAVLSSLIKSIAAETTVPVILHLDHGKNPALVENCIKAGYTSVMIDASDKLLPENILITKRIVSMAHTRHVWVEAELGSILGAEGAKKLGTAASPENYLTDPKQVRQFVAETGIDALAVSVGTIHGAFTGQEYIRFELLADIAQRLPDLPLVVHGASGIPGEYLRQAAATNVCKINIDTELRLAFEEAIKAYLGENRDLVDPRKMLGPAREAVHGVVLEKIRLFGSANRVRLINNEFKNKK